MTYEKIPNQTGQNFPVSPQYATFPGSAVGFPASPQYETFPTGVVVPLPDDPTIIFGANVLQYIEGDTGITIAGSGISQVDDLSGAGLHYTQGSDTSRPAVGAGVLNGRNVIQFDGVDNFLTSSLNLPAPGTTPTHLRMVVLQSTWTTGRAIVGGGVDNNVVLENAAVTPNTRLRTNGAGTGPNNGGLTLGSWFRVRAGWTNSVADYLRIGATEVTGTNVGNNASVGRALATRANATTVVTHIWVAALLYLDAAPTAGQEMDLDDFWLAKWGSGVTFG